MTASDDSLRASFYKLENARDVAVMLDVPYATLVFYTYRGADAERYGKFEIAKRRGGMRSISAPTTGLKIIQQKLNQVFLAVYETKPAVHGFAREKNISTNATVHRRKRYVFNVDLADFFPSINFGRVRGMFMAKPYSRNATVATMLARICCFENQLPQGAPTSPTVSNMLCGKLDSDLRRLGNRVNAAYSRYADDITFSTNEKVFPTPLAARNEEGRVVCGRELTRVIEANGFSVNPSKTRLLTRADRQEVTGLTVNVKVNVQRRYIRRVRAMLHRLSREDNNKLLLRQVKGRIDFIGQVRGRGDALYRRLLTRYAALDTGFLLPPAPNPSLINAVDKNVWVIEWMADGGGEQGTAVLIRDVGFVTCAHVLGTGAYAYRANKPEDRRSITVLHSDLELDLALISISGIEVDEKSGLVLSGQIPQSLQQVYVAGFPSFAPGATIQIHPAHVVGRRQIANLPIISLGASVFAGASGGPVVNDSHEVIGIAVRGAQNESLVEQTDRYGAIPVESIREFLARAARSKP